MMAESFNTVRSTPPARDVKQPKTQPHTEAPVHRPGRTARVLVVEDDGEMREMIAHMLELEGYDVERSPDILHMLEFFMDSSGAPQNFDLVISDIRMPGISGIEALEGMRYCDCHVPPFVFITAFGDASTHERAAELGAAATLDKPFEMQDLLEMVASLTAKGFQENQQAGHASNKKAGNGEA